MYHSKLGGYESILPGSSRRYAEVALAESEHRYLQLLEVLPDAAYTCDADGRVTWFNAAAAELWGRQPVLGTRPVVSFIAHL